MNYEKFHEYLWYLVHRPFKGINAKKSDIYKLFKALGKVLDRIKQDIFKLRRQAIISTADSKALEMHGRDRLLQKYANETYEQYRTRLLAKREIAEMAGTLEGIVVVLKSLGYQNAYIEPTYRYDPDRWAEFLIFIEKERLNVLNNFDIVQREVRKVKQGSAYPNYAFTHKDEIEITKTIFAAKFDNEDRICGDFYTGEM